MGILKRRTGGDVNSSLRGRSSGAARNFYLIHVTAVGTAREIIRSEQIEARICKVFGENLAYFFVMRPAYKLRDADKKNDIIDFFPFVFLVSTENLGAPYHVYPFDTGGALEGAFDEGASPAVFLEDYALEETLQAVNDHVDWAFGTPADYYDGKLKPNFTNGIADWDVGPRTFAKISRLASVGSNRPDRRASAIEIAYSRHVPLSEVKFAILPYQFLEDPHGPNTDMIDRLTAAGVSWETYQWRANRSPADFHNEINKLVRDHLASCGQI